MKNQQQVKVNNLTQTSVQPIAAYFCTSFACRLRGLTFRGPLSPDEGLLLVQNRENRMDAAIHMLGVWMDLGVIWINSAGVVVDSRLARPWRPIYVPRYPARYVLEISPARLIDFEIGDLVQIEEVGMD